LKGEFLTKLTECPKAKGIPAEIVYALPGRRVDILACLKSTWYTVMKGFLRVIKWVLIVTVSK
jgi:hypothetical protein